MSKCNYTEQMKAQGQEAMIGMSVVLNMHNIHSNTEAHKHNGEVMEVVIFVDCCPLLVNMETKYCVLANNSHYLPVPDEAN